VSKTISVDFKAAAVSRDARVYRLCQAAALLKLFHNAHGREAVSTEELSEWRATQPKAERPIDPYSILTDDEIKAVIQSMR
jgi:hypothetical protein